MRLSFCHIGGPLLCALLLAGCKTLPHEGATCALPSTVPAATMPAGTDEEITATDTSFDAAAGVIKYTLPEDAVVRIRIGMANNGPMVRTLVDWEKRAKGPHIEQWDRKDASGLLDLTGRNDLMIIFAALPVDESRRSAYHGRVRGLRKAPGLELLFPDSTEKTKEGLPILKGVAAVRIKLDDKDRAWLITSKYEIGLYMDYVFLMEDEEGVDPSTYRLNTINLPNGPHAVTANITGYEGDVGAHTVMVYIQN